MQRRSMARNRWGYERPGAERRCPRLRERTLVYGVRSLPRPVYAAFSGVHRLIGLHRGVAPLGAIFVWFDRVRGSVAPLRRNSVAQIAIFESRLKRPRAQYFSFIWIDDELHPPAARVDSYGDNLIATPPERPRETISFARQNRGDASRRDLGVRFDDRPMEGVAVGREKDLRGRLPGFGAGAGEHCERKARVKNKDF
jgi:hypothetical protein